MDNLDQPTERLTWEEVLANVLALPQEERMKVALTIAAEFPDEFFEATKEDYVDD